MTSRAITVSQLKCACVDSAWRARWLRGEKPSTQIFGRPRPIPVQGLLFHQLAEAFVEWLRQASSKKRAASLVDAGGLWASLYTHFAQARLEELIVAGKLPSAHHLSQALRAFCTQLAELRTRTPNFASWQDVYLTHESPIDAIPFTGATGELLISGRPDAVRTHPQDGLEVVDYKLSRGSHLKHDLLQLAIYAHLLRIIKPGLKFSGVLEFYEPDLHIVPVTMSELEGIFEKVVAPVISEINGGEPG